MAKLTTPILLVIEREGQERRIEEFNEHIIKIGKLSSVNLRLDDPNVNRIHAVIEVTSEEEAQVIDMGSSKGTRVNGKRIHKARVVTGDQIVLGDTSLAIYIGDSAVDQARLGNFVSGNHTPDVEDEPEAPPAPAALPPAPAIPGIDAPLDMSVADAPSESTQVSRNPLLDAQNVQVNASQSEPAQPPPADTAPLIPAALPPQDMIEANEDPGEDTAHIPEAASLAVREASAQAEAQEQAWAEQQAQQQQQPMHDPYAQQAEQDPYQHQPQAEVQQPMSQDNGYPADPYAAQQQAYGQPQQAQYEQPQQGYGYDPAQAQSGYGFAQQQPVMQAQPVASYPPQPAYGYAQQPMQPGFAPQQGFAPQPGFVAPGMAQPPIGAPGSQQSMQGMPQAAPAPLQSAPDNTNYADSQEVLEVRVLWGDTILDHAHFYEPKRITIGESRKNTFSLSSEALPDGITSFPLIEAEGDRLLINFTDAMGGEVHLKQEQLLSLEQIKTSAKVQRTELGYQFALPAQSRVRLFVGDLVFEISFVPAPKRLPPAILNQMDHHLARSMGASFLLHGILILMMLFADESQTNLDEGFLKQSNRFAQLIVRPNEPEKKKKLKESGGAKAKGKEGKMGKKTAANVKRRAGQVKKNPDGTAPIDMQKTAKAVMDKLTKKGLLGLLPGGGSKAGGIITAKGFGGDDSDALGGWHGSKVGDALGGGGLGLKGGGAGGGGFSGSSAGLGRVGTYGRGGGRGGRGWGNSRLRGKRKRAVSVSTGPPSVYGGLDRKIIQRIINQNRRRFKYCYERELIKNQRLQGKIHVWFQIEANGRVYTSRVSQTTMNNDRVEQCLVRRVRVMRFPAPKGGGVVIVNYPFIFRPS